MRPNPFVLRCLILALALLTLPLLSIGVGAERERATLVMLIAEDEYETATTLPAFAAEHLARDFRVVAVQGSVTAGAPTFTSLGEVERADVLLISVRRRPLPVEQLDVIRRYVAAGKP